MNKPTHTSGKPPLRVGDRVSLERWDAYDPPDKKLGSPGIVVLVEDGQWCESGTMITVAGSTGKSRRLDRNWLEDIMPS